MNNLANVYWSQGKYGQAQALHSQALAIQRRVLGPEHPDTFLSMGNLADAYARDGKYAEAEPLFNQTVEISRRVLGPEHPRTFAFLMDLASMYQRQGRYAAAETSQRLPGLCASPPRAGILTSAMCVPSASVQCAATLTASSAAV